MTLQSIDEMNNVVGPHKTTQVVMARGLFSKWKQPVFYDYDRAMDKKLLDNIIMKLYESGFTVVATTSDLGSTNSTVKNYLKIGTEENQQCYFEHPSDNKLLIHIFADVPHLIKLARNHFLDSGFFLQRNSSYEESSRAGFAVQRGR